MKSDTNTLYAALVGCEAELEKIKGVIVNIRLALRHGSMPVEPRLPPRKRPALSPAAKKRISAAQAVGGVSQETED